MTKIHSQGIITKNRRCSIHFISHTVKDIISPGLESKDTKTIRNRCQTVGFRKK